MRFDWESVRKAGTSVGVALTVTGAVNTVFIAESSMTVSLIFALAGVALIFLSNLRK